MLQCWMVFFGSPYVLMATPAPTVRRWLLSSRIRCRPVHLAEVRRSNPPPAIQASSLDVTNSGSRLGMQPARMSPFSQSGIAWNAGINNEDLTWLNHKEFFGWCSNHQLAMRDLGKWSLFFLLTRKHIQRALVDWFIYAKFVGVCDDPQ